MPQSVHRAAAFLWVFAMLRNMSVDEKIKKEYNWSRETIQAQWQTFDFYDDKPLTEIEVNYCRHYRLDFSDQIDGVEHRFGYTEVDGYQLSTHYYRPSLKPQGVVLALHGYFDHSGLYRHLIEYCLQRNYAVLTYDLPGHGLSTGGEGEIDDFLEYVQVLVHYVGLAQELPGPLHLVGSSTGGAIIMEYLAEHDWTAENNPFASILLLAPLVRPVKWVKLLLMYYTMRYFVRSVERSLVESSHDQDFVTFVEYDDPLQNRRVASSWIGALIRWVGRFKRARIALSPVVIQGGEDETIDWQYNLKMIKQNFQTPKVHFIPEARHQLVNESLEIRQQVFAYLDRYLLGDAEN